MLDVGTFKTVRIFLAVRSPAGELRRLKSRRTVMGAGLKTTPRRSA
jgi:hypothetical protein